MNAQIKFSPMWSPSDSVLCCPSCGFHCLHQEDCRPIEEHGDRGVTIGFWCEGCPVVSYLFIYQHKGNTFVEWLTGDALRRAVFRLPPPPATPWIQPPPPPAIPVPRAPVAATTK